MDKIEILKLAFSKTATAEEGMKLAREMEAFIRSENPVPKWVTETIKEIDAAPQHQATKAHNHRQPWDKDAILHLCKLLNDDRHPIEIAQIMKRSEKSILSAIRRLNRGEYMRVGEGQPR